MHSKPKHISKIENCKQSDTCARAVYFYEYGVIIFAPRSRQTPLESTVESSLDVTGFCLCRALTYEAPLSGLCRQQTARQRDSSLLSLSANSAITGLHRPPGQSAARSVRIAANKRLVFLPRVPKDAATSQSQVI